MKTIEVGKLYYQDWTTELSLQHSFDKITTIKKYEPFMILACDYITPSGKYQKIDILTSKGLKIWFYISSDKENNNIHKITTDTPIALHSTPKSL
jgi:hypothetical protein